MIGDSITKGSTPALEERFELLGLDANIEAQNGKRMAVSSGDNPSGSSVAEFIASSADDHSDELWVVALGTNDIGQYASSDEIAAAVNEVLDAVPDESPLVWVDAYYRDQAEQQDIVNMIIRDRVARRGNSVVAPWTEFATGAGVLSLRRCAPEHRRRRGLRVRRHRHRQRLPRPLMYTMCQTHRVRQLSQRD